MFIDREPDSSQESTFYYHRPKHKESYYTGVTFINKRIFSVSDFFIRICTARQTILFQSIISSHETLSNKITSHYISSSKRNTEKRKNECEAIEDVT
jgi:hypothetical protein